MVDQDVISPLLNTTSPAPTGDQTTRPHAPVAVAFVTGLTNPSLTNTVSKRLSLISIDGRANATVLAGLIRDHPRSIFPTIRSTERVDVACQALLEAKVVILVDGDPFALSPPPRLRISMAPQWITLGPGTIHHSYALSGS